MLKDGKGWRRAVAAPEPWEIIALAAIRSLMDAGFVDLTFMEDVARKYAQGDFSVLAEVWIPKGTRVLPMFQITESDQGDLLLPRDSHFLVRDMDERKDLLQITLELVG